MSLNWDLTRIKNSKDLCWIPNKKRELEMNPVTNALIWGTMAVGIGEITEKNLPEWRFRLEVLARIGSHLMNRTVPPAGPVGINPTLEELTAHVGLRTNVFPMETRTKWMNRVRDLIARDAQRIVQV